MKKSSYIILSAWILGAIIWAIVAYISFSENNSNFAWIQTILSIGFLVTAIVKFFIYRKNS